MVVFGPIWMPTMSFWKTIKFWVFYECLKIIKILSRTFLPHTQYTWKNANRSARKKHSTMGRYHSTGRMEDYPSWNMKRSPEGSGLSSFKFNILFHFQYLHYFVTLLGKRGWQFIFYFPNLLLFDSLRQDRWRGIFIFIKFSGNKSTRAHVNKTYSWMNGTKWTKII